MIKKILFVLTLTAAISTSCKKEDPVAEGSIEITAIQVLDTSRLSCSVAVSLVNTETAMLGFYLFDTNMNLLDSVESGSEITSGSFTKTISKLKRGKEYKIVAYVYNKEMKKVKSSATGFRTRSFTVTRISHQNYLLNYSLNGVRPEEKIFITGKNLSSFNNEHCKLLLDSLQGKVNIISKTDSLLTVSVDKSINDLFTVFYRKYSLVVKEYEDTLATSSIFVFTDKPFLERVEIGSNVFFRLYGSFGNKGVDSAFINNTKFSLEGNNLDRSNYYHQAYLQYVGLAKALNPGTYTIRVYLNGYEASLKNVLIE